MGKFVKGMSGNPKGRPPKTLGVINNELTAKGFTPVRSAEISDLLACLFNATEDELESFAQDKRTPYFVRRMIEAIMESSGREFMAHLEVMLSRAYGKPKQMTLLEQAPQSIVISLGEGIRPQWEETGYAGDGWGDRQG